LPDAVAWTTPAVGVRYRPRPPLGPLVSRDLVELREPVQELAADGDRVAYRSCGTIAVWRPGDASVVSQQIDRPLCGETNIGFYSLALAGDKIAWGSLRGGTFRPTRSPSKPSGSRRRASTSPPATTRPVILAVTNAPAI